ncbi:MAG: lysylphosphatidylglycerol synthase domain-containing protein [Elusimicrobiota bacterium]|nr:MAG: lysylphosphatidylglycerol synthase domain-containing protein [Elusimicrobiota bacterium]
MNVLLPSGLGGEPLKAAALARWVSAPAAMSSVAVAKAAQTAALLAFIAAGAGLAAGRAALPAGLLRAVALVCALLGCGVLALLLLPASGLLGGAAGPRPGRAASILSRLAESARAFEDAQRSFLRGHKARLAASVGWHFLGWSAGAIEVRLLARAFGVPVGLDDAFIMSSLAMAVSVAGFFVPGMLGSFEAGHAAGAAVIGLSPELGLSIALLRRAREALWAGLGLLGAWRLSLWSPRPGGALIKAAAFVIALALAGPATAQTQTPAGAEVDRQADFYDIK